MDRTSSLAFSTFQYSWATSHTELCNICTLVQLHLFSYRSNYIENSTVRHAHFIHRNRQGSRYPSTLIKCMIYAGELPTVTITVGLQLIFVKNYRELCVHCTYHYIKQDFRHYRLHSRHRLRRPTSEVHSGHYCTGTVWLRTVGYLGL